MRLGLLGGTFDPVHYGHLLLAEYCRTECELDNVWFIPAAIAPHKTDNDSTPPQQRVEMLELAIAGHEAFEICGIEVDRGGVSYTVETLRELTASSPQKELFLLLGADSLLDLPNWKEPKQICSLATLLVVSRPTIAPPDFDCLKAIASPTQLERVQKHHVQMPSIGISSSEIRRRVANGLSIRYQTPRAVEKYIAANQLYRA